MHRFTLISGKEIPSWRRSRLGIAAWVALVVGSLSATSIRAEELALDLTGSWYLIVHYRDADSRDPEQVQWEDRVWIFEQRESRLEWTEYGVVVFESERGRFESLASGRVAKALGAWSPDAEQLKEIEAGLGVSSRGSRTKTLRGSAESGYRSSGAARRDSFSVIGFTETWELTGLTGSPIFQLSDMMASGRSDSLDGNTSYATTAIEGRAAEPQILKGDFDRDGVHKGTFTMMRTGSISFPKSK